MDKLTTKLNKLYATPRMSHGAVENTNSVVGLHQMIREHFKPDFEMVEVGSFEGTSTLLFSLFVNKVYAVDCFDYRLPPEGRIPAMDKLFVKAEKTFDRRTVKSPNIIKIRKTSEEASKDFTDESLDAVYIDAEHDEESVRVDLKLWKPKVKKGGYMSGHDWWLPHIQRVVQETLGEGAVIYVYSDSSWISKI